MDLESLKLVLLGGVREELMENLNLFENGDIFHLSYEKINKVFKNYSKDGSKNNRDCGCVVATRGKTAMLYPRIIVLFTLCTLLNAIICCLQLNTERGADANRKVDYLVIDAVGLTVCDLCCNAQSISWYSSCQVCALVVLSQLSIAQL